jgi:hypothetical protein
MEKNAYELTGQPPVNLLTTDQVAARIGAALEEAIKITRKKAVLEEAMNVGGGVYWGWELTEDALGWAPPMIGALCL